jgi:uncharacterized protein YcgI (DUF1989 family)
MTSFLNPAPPFNRKFYEDLRSARPSFREAEKSIISLEQRGKAFVVKKGQSVRIVCVEGPQIADVCFWNANDYKERLWDDQTLNREGFYLTTFSRLWSNMPNFRPMMTIIEDTVETKPTHAYSRHHYIFGSHCNPHYWYWALRDKSHPYVTTYNCHYNFIRAVKPFGLVEEDIHDNLNLFMKCYFDLETGLHPVEPSDAKKGDYVEFYAEMDVLVAVSVCPNGSATLPSTVGEQDIKPLGIEIYETGIQPLGFEDVFGL